MQEEKLVPSANKHFHCGFFEQAKNNYEIKSLLKQIPFEECYLVPTNENLDENPFTDATACLMGCCHAFSYALHLRFGYERYEILNKSGNIIHSFAQASYKGKTAYIDVRGITTDTDEFFEEFRTAIDTANPPSPKPAEPVSIDEEWFQSALFFSFALIDTHPEFYDINFGNA